MELSFYKLRLFRNDFVLVPPNPKQTLPDEIAANLARSILRRRTGVGAAGLILLDTDGQQAIQIRFYDASGSSLDPSGDALLCASRYLFDSGRTDGRNIRLATRSQVNEVSIVDSNQLELDIGTPIDPRTNLRVDPSPEADTLTHIEVDGKSYATMAVLLKTPCLVFLPAPKLDLRTFSNRVQGEIGAGGLQPVFVRPLSPEEQKVFAWPTHEPIDCASIVGCAAVATSTSGFSEGIILSHYAATRAFVRWSRRENRVIVTSSPDYVFSGDYSSDVDSE